MISRPCTTSARLGTAASNAGEEPGALSLHNLWTRHGAKSSTRNGMARTVKIKNATPPIGKQPAIVQATSSSVFGLATSIASFFPSAKKGIP
jgi:hypothetical protein